MPPHRTAAPPPPEPPAAAAPATYGPETPWLCWDKWAKSQHYRQANPPWFRAFTSLWTVPKYRQVWEPHGDRGAALLFRLTHHLAARSRIGAVWGDPVALQRELGLAEPPDLSWLLAAGWCRYISDAEKQQREQEAAEPRAKTRARPAAAPQGEVARPARQAASMREAGAEAWLRRHPTMRAGDLAEQLGCSVRTVQRLSAWRQRDNMTAEHDKSGTIPGSLAAANQPCRGQKSRCDKEYAKPEERRGEESRVEKSKPSRSSASVRAPQARAPSLRVGAGHTEQSRAGQSTDQERPAEPEGQQRPGEPAQPANPKEPEAGGATRTRRPRRRSRPPRASPGGGPALMGSALRLYWQDPEAVSFGEAIFATLWPGRSTEGDEAASEIGAFAKLYFERVRTTVPVLELPHFRARAIAKAKHIAKYGKSADSKGAVLTSLVQRMLGTSARASPAG